MKILLIEDNARLVERIKHHLKKSFIVDVATTGAAGLERIQNIQYTAILLDLNLPDMNGQTICKQLRAEGNTTPILIISAQQDHESRVALLDCGADDFLVKPFNPLELIARIRSLARRYRPDYDRHILTAHDLIMDVSRRHVSRSGQHIELRKKEFDILEYLLANQGRAVTRSMILGHVWDSNEETWHKTVDVHIKYLRDKIDRPFASTLIKTAYGVGYMIDV